MYAQFEEDVNIAVESFIILTPAGRDAAFKRIKAAYENEHERQQELQGFEERCG